MTLEKFGKTLLFLVGAFMVFIAAKGVIRVVDPYTRRVSASLADFLKSV